MRTPRRPNTDPWAPRERGTAHAAPSTEPHQRGVDALAELLAQGCDVATFAAAAVHYLDGFAVSIENPSTRVGEMRSASMLYKALVTAGLPTGYTPPVKPRVGPDPDLGLMTLNLTEERLYQEKGWTL